MNLSLGGQKWVKSLWVRMAVCIAGALLFLGAVYVVAYHKADLWNLWLPTSEYNDEVYYNKELLGMIAGGGQPQGVFGYNEKGAVLGHFSVWGPVVFYLYALPALLVGQGVNTMFWCNILLFVVGWTIFCVGNRLPWQKQLAFAALMVCMWFPIQQVFTGMSEVLHYLLLWVILTGSAALYKKYNRLLLAAVILACMLETVMRAYLVLFWIFPIVALWKKKRNTIWVNLTGIVVSMAGYLVVSKWFSSPYLPDAAGIDLSFFELLVHGRIVEAFVYEFTHVYEQLHNLWDLYVHPTFYGQGPEQGGVYLITLLIMAVTLLCIVYDWKRKNAVWLKVCAFVCTGISLVALVSFYTLDPMSRHCILLDVMLVSAVIAEGEQKELRFCPLVLVLLVVIPGNFSIHTLPTYDAEMDAQLIQIRQALTQSREALGSEDPWDNTVAFGSREGVFEGFLYAVPEGMGLQYDRSTLLADEASTINSRYVMVGHGTDAEARLIADGWRELVSTESLIVYERCD